MMVAHHISDELLLSYASGNLAEGWSLAVATHLALCPACRHRLFLMEKTAGQLLVDLAPEPAADGSWERMLARIQSAEGTPTSQPVAVSPACDEIPILPDPLRTYLGGDVTSLKWIPLGRGAYHIPIPTMDRKTKARLLRIPAGKPVPEHGHGGRELTVVLTGSFRDGEELFARGDIEEADTSLTHQPIATPEQDCICLAVTDAPLRFSNWLLRLVQPALGI
ncbi:ChrR family anti-sigma-E factor [Rhizobiaceae bacterium n13]|uniref:ChrR family anti-sigma-E factor n=1 Tax=Ferirhizobium litorale TaxID=2927786 RepID=A0AAE3QH69_9HYPH|nr:ChrR family anti-sigma-E factor [Fererhizobium litorale]MDI7862622.1 ChrR family anti-sigma-E factor [Fererhizobium litorale]MDI7923895.1 ChrR family anti-sigma-E factor [Fererhizobium litorale]